MNARIHILAELRVRVRVRREFACVLRVRVRGQG